ncbi:hypothetical protein PINS_up010230 [Pythium insidiosum]|nr:hypothetical protein PINS_up010230 [Pythium insidiosum]
MHAVGPALRPPPQQQPITSTRAVKATPWLLWLVIVAIHSLGAGYAACLALLYVRLPVDAETLVSNIELYHLSIHPTHFPTVAAVYLSLAIAHVLVLLRIALLSLRFRRLLLIEPEHGHGARLSLFCGLCIRVGRLLASLSQRLVPRRLKTPVVRAISSRVVSSARTAVSSTSVTDPNYGKARAVWELVETAFLTAQAHKASYRVANPWINSVQVALLVLNCWCYTITGHMPHASNAWRRLMYLYVNVCIDLTVYAVIPIALFLPYWRAYRPSMGDFGIIFWYTDRSLVRVLNEFPVLLVTSFWDGVSKLFVALRVMRALLDIPRLQRLIEWTRVASSTIHPADKAQVARLRALPASRIERGCHLLLFLWGAVILGLHIHATSHTSNPRCLEQVRPWTARRAACSLAEISCAHGLISGRAAEFDAALQEIDRKWLTYLIIRHCPAIEMTPTLQDLPNIVGLKTYNSTLARWGPEAALTAQHHAHVRFVFLAATNMSAFPRGLYDANFPSQLMDVEICRSNLTLLPATLSDVWPQGMFLLLEETQLTTVPPVLGTLRPLFLSLCANGFTSLPAFVIENPLLQFLKVNGNPLTELPALTVGRDIVPPLILLYIAGTNISQVPLWIDTHPMVSFDASGSPLCETLQTLDASSLSDAKTAALKRVVRCQSREDEREMTHFPIKLEAAINP